MQFFCDTVTEMARRQFVSGSPLRTLSLLLAGQPAEVFAAPSPQSGNPMGGVVAASEQSEVFIHSWIWRCQLVFVAFVGLPSSIRSRI